MEDFKRLIGGSQAIRVLEDEATAASCSDAKVLISGESGVGKEIVARLIHARSARKSAPLVTLNCAGIPETLLESELFGHRQGSFTGAYRDRSGLLQTAHRGTLFLDETSEMSFRMQGLLLRFLETGEVQRVGEDRWESRVDVRVIAATNRDLKERIEARLFREDLYYRLNVIHIAIPPLRARAQDIPMFVEYFLKLFSERYRVERPRLTPEAAEALRAYRWPGNVRELKNLVERLVVTAPGRVTDIRDLPREIRGSSAPPPAVAVRPEGRTVGEQLFDQMVNGRQSFWSTVYGPFMARDLTRDDLRRVVSLGLERTSGSYKVLIELFNMSPNDYKRVLNFLRKHNCHMPFQKFRSAPAKVQSVSDPSRHSVA
jgi:DNA-binding NtrC family response regulator